MNKLLQRNLGVELHVINFTNLNVSQPGLRARDLGNQRAALKRVTCGHIV
jgi:hypothetical protein